MTVKTMSHKTLVSKNSKNMLNDPTKNNNNKTKTFNFQKYDKEKQEESKDIPHNVAGKIINIILILSHRIIIKN